MKATYTLLIILIPFVGFGQDEFNIQEMLDAHNKYRSELNIKPLVWSEKLSKTSQKWANELSKKGRLIHCKSKKYCKDNGENLALFEGYNLVSPTMVVDEWATEIECFDYKTKDCISRGCVCGHYTQIIWRDTNEVGCAKVKKGNKEFWVCQYLPAGNYINQKPY